MKVEGVPHASFCHTIRSLLFKSLVPTGRHICQHWKSSTSPHPPFLLSLWGFFSVGGFEPVSFGVTRRWASRNVCHFPILSTPFFYSTFTAVLPGIATSFRSSSMKGITLKEWHFIYFVGLLFLFVLDVKWGWPWSRHGFKLNCFPFFKLISVLWSLRKPQ